MFGDEVGSFPDIPEKEYHALKIPSSSSIKIYLKNPALYQLDYLQGEQSLFTQALQLGRAFETIILEPEKVSKIKTFSTKTYSSQEALGLHAADPGSIWVSETDFNDVFRWAECWKAKDLQYKRGEENIVQLACIVEVIIDGFPYKFKCRLDDVDMDNRIIFDNKLMDDASHYGFKKSVNTYGYDIQAALYTLAMQILFPGEPWQFVFNVQEKHQYGYDTRFSVQYKLDEYLIQAASYKIELALQCIYEEDFHGYSGGIIYQSSSRV